MEKLKGQYRRYYASVHSIDRNLGRLLRRLDELDLSRRTIILFTSDNGFFMGYRGLNGKGAAGSFLRYHHADWPSIRNMYDLALRVPLIVRWPGVAKPGTVIDELVSNVDTYATVLGMLGIPISPEDPDAGKDFSPLLRGDKVSWRDAVFGQYDTYVLGNAAGRPLINAVGKPRVVINGTALDYLAESFMAGDPLNGGGFVVLNGICFDDRDGSIREYESPYPGSNIFSLASGGAIYVRDPHRKLVDEQLNGGEFAGMTDADWALIQPYLEENEKLFDVTVDRLLTIDGVRRAPKDVYRKIGPKKTTVPVADDDAELPPWNTGAPQ